MMDFLQSVAIIVASVTAILGIYTWRNEHVGKQKIDLSEDVLAKVYELKDIIKFIRSYVGYVGEGKSREKNEVQPKEVQEIFDNAYVVVERYNKQQEKFNEFYALKYRYMAKFGKEAVKPFVIIREVINEIIHSSNVLGRIWQQDRWIEEDSPDYKKHLEKKDKYEAIFWDTDENHELNKKINTAIEFCEKICKEANEAKIHFLI